MEQLKKRYLVLFFNDARADNLLLDKLNEYQNVKSYCVFKSVNLVQRILRRIHFKFFINRLDFWFLNWKMDLNNYDCVICIASRYSPKILNWIHRNYPYIRLINYYWDQLNVSGYPYEENSIYENWTFSYSDSQRFEMHYNPQFWVEKLSISKLPIKYDLTYIGADRNGTLKYRSSLISHLYKILKNTDLRVFFYYVSNNKNIPTEICYKVALKEEVFYQYISKSKVVLELVEENEQWITLRTFLALCNKKKLITNNKTIVNESFFNANNIFVLGFHDEKNLEKFISTPYDESTDHFLREYEFSNWIKRFENSFNSSKGL